MKTVLYLCVILFAIVATSITAYCQPDSLVDNIKTVDGSVVSVDVQNSKIVIKSYETMTFYVPSSANIINADGFSIQLSDVRVGSYVNIGYRNNRSGEHIMTGMEVDYRN